MRRTRGDKLLFQSWPGYFLCTRIIVPGSEPKSIEGLRSTMLRRLIDQRATKRRQSIATFGNIVFATTQRSRERRERCRRDDVDHPLTNVAFGVPGPVEQTPRRVASNSRAGSAHRGSRSAARRIITGADRPWPSGVLDGRRKLAGTPPQTFNFYRGETLPGLRIISIDRDLNTGA